MIALTLGTGLGGGVVIDGRLLLGAHGAAAELGHIGVSDREDAPPCSTAVRGCLESYVCAPAMIQYALEQRENFPDSLLFQERAGQPLTAKAIHEAALKEDRLALRTIEHMATYLGFGLASLICCFDPDLIVIGGGVANMADLFLDQTKRVVRERVYFHSITKLDIVLAQLGADDGYKGSAALALFPCV